MGLDNGPVSTPRPGLGRRLVALIKRPGTAALLAAAVILGAAGIFLAGKPLSEQDQYASVFSFVLSAASLALAVRTSRPTASSPAPNGPASNGPAASSPPAPGGTEFDAQGNSYAVLGPGKRVDVTKTVLPPTEAVPPAESDGRFRAYHNGVAVLGPDGHVSITDAEH